MLSLFAALWSAPVAAAGPSASVAFAFEPHFASLDVHNDQLEAYGYAPIGRFVPHFGVRAVIEYPFGLRTGMTASSGFASNAAAGNPVPSTTTWTKVGAVVGWRAHRFVALEADIGFGALTHAVGSDRGGGALQYLGPYLAPRADFVVLDAPAWLALGVGWMVHLPAGSAHNQPLWEASFDRGVVHGPMLSVQSGMGVR